MATIQFRKDCKKNPWRAQIRLKGFPSMQKTFETEEEAKLWAQITEESLRSNSTLPTLTLNDFFDRYELEIIPKKNPKYKEKEKPVIKFWRDNLGNKIASEISSNEIEEIANTLYKKTTHLGTNFSAKSRRKYIQSLKYVYNIALKYWKWVINNPVSGVDLHSSSINKQLNEYKNKVIHPVKEFKKEFIYLLHQQLKKKNIPTHIGIDLIDFLGFSKSILQHLHDPDTNVTLSTILQVAEKAGIKINLSVDQSS